MGRTLVNRWDELFQSTNKFIIDLVESSRDVPSQFGRDDSSVIAIVHVQVAQGVLGLKELICLH